MISQKQKMKMQQKLTPQQLMLMRLLQLPVTQLEQKIKEEVEKDTLSVIIAQSPCALLKSYVPKGRCKVDPEKCKKCGMCLKPGCPAIKKDETTGFAVIDDTMCNGCGLCQQLCPFGAIELIAK